MNYIVIYKNHLFLNRSNIHAILGRAYDLLLTQVSTFIRVFEIILLELFYLSLLKKVQF